MWLVLRSPLLDTERLKALSAFYALLLLVALTNMELLRLMPWRKGPTTYDGLPDKRLMLRIWLLVMCLEDVPQLAIQVAILMIADTGGVLAPLSIAFSLSAIVWRGLRKVIYLVPPNARIAITELMGSGRLSLEADTAPQPANSPSATGASVASDTPPPVYDDNGGLEIEHVEVSEKMGSESTKGISLHAFSPSVASSGSTIAESYSQSTSTLPSALSSSASSSLATTTHFASGPGRSDFTTINSGDLPSAAARVVQDVAPRFGPAWRARQQEALEVSANEPLVVGVANVRASDIRFDSPRLRLGAGAFGTVYRSAEEGWQGSTVAVKELKIDGSEETLATTLAALRREAATLASLRHHNVVSFLGVCLQASQPMLVTEYVAGGVLEDALHPRGGSSSLGHLDRLKIAKDIAAGLTHVHSQSILHRDLKPANVLLAKIDGGLVAKVADVGLARTLHGARQHMSAMTGGGAGTPQYMSPEQWSDQVRSAPPCCSGSL